MPEEQQQQNKTPSLQDAIVNSGLLSDKSNGEISSGFKKYNSKLKPLRTYQGDVDDAVGKTKASVISIAVAEQEKKYEIAPIISEEKKPNNNVRNKIFIAVGTVLFVLGVTTVGFVYYLNSQNVVINPSTKNTILDYSEKFNIPIASTTREDLIGIIKTKTKDLNLTVNSILYLNTTDGDMVASKDKVFELLAPSMPPPLIRSLNDSYMIGVFSFNKNEPFIILKTNDYGASFAGMLKWEETMVSDIGSLFGIDPSIGTSTPYVFGDETIRNKDLRIVKDENNKTILLYSFIDKNTIVITDTEDILNAIVGKYITDQMVR